MGRLLLFRHAKSERTVSGQPDRGRQINERGRQDAPRMAEFMARYDLSPDRAIVSSATRTRETWALLSPAFKETQVRFEDRLYDASALTILDVITHAETAECLLIVAHNPGLQQLALMLIGSGSAEARQRLADGFPTSGLAVIDCAIDSWDCLKQQSGSLAHFVYPRALAANDD